MSANQAADAAFRVGHRQWMELAAEEYRRLLLLVATLTPEEWAAPTDCAGWTVRDIVAHLTGAAAASASLREQMRQQKHGRANRGSGTQLDAVNQLQIAERANLDTDALVAALTASAERGLRSRRSMPLAVRGLRFPFPPPLGWASLGFLSDTVYTRDAWMHRIDICRAIRRPLELTGAHDGVIVMDAAQSWFRLQRPRPSRLVLTGPAGGTWTSGRPTRGNAVETRYTAATFDAIDFARALSGRDALPGVRADVVLF